VLMKYGNLYLPNVVEETCDWLCWDGLQETLCLKLSCVLSQF
jgi:hypothetical protein